MLFSYYAVLNAGIFGIAWFKAWRALNLVGFWFTVVIAAFWGASSYRPEYFASTEPFLILFFAFYVALAVLYALRQSMDLKQYLDATLVFGTPLVAAGLQSALVHDMPYVMAWSALALAAVYLLLARVLHARRGESLRLLVEAFLALGVIFATLAIPLALDARWSSAAWALEGAAILWAGVRQGRLGVRVFAVLLELAAAVAFAWELPTRAGDIDLVPVLNRDCLGAALISLAGLFSAWLLQRSRDVLRPAERVLAPLFFAWGCAWWLGGGWREIERALAGEFRMPALVAFLAATAAAFSLAARRYEWPQARVPVFALPPLLLAIALALVLDHRGHLFGSGGLAAWLFAIAVSVWLLVRLEREPVPSVLLGRQVDLAWGHILLVWLVALLAAHELSWLGGRLAGARGVWTLAPWGLVPALALLILTRIEPGMRWPFGHHARAYRVIAAGVVAGLALLWSIVSDFTREIDPGPLPYVPLLNPLDIAQAAALLAIALWLVRVRDDGLRWKERLPAGAWTVVAALPVFLWTNALVLRSIHFWFDVPYRLPALWQSTLVQAALSLLWTLLALAAMVLSHRRRWRPVWMTGAALLAIVVAKLFLVDLSRTVGAERIVSFIGVGLMLLVIGYFAPIPPRAKETSA